MWRTGEEEMLRSWVPELVICPGEAPRATLEKEQNLLTILMWAFINPYDEFGRPEEGVRLLLLRECVFWRRGAAGLRA
jgi:hypothetical protein